MTAGAPPRTPAGPRRGWLGRGWPGRASSGRRWPGRGRPGTLAVRVVVPLLAVAAWEAATRAAHDVFFPPPVTIVGRMYHLWFSGPVTHAFLTPDAVADLLPSLARMAAGLGAATVLGVAAGLALGRSARLTDYLDPLLQFARAIPPPTLVPVLVVLEHLGTTMQVTSILLGAVWPILLNTADGARSVDGLQLATARAFRLTTWQRLRYVVVPSTLPRVFTGLRLSLSLSLILMVFSELLPGASDGIGFELTNAQSRSDLPTVWAALVLLGVLGYLLNTLLLAAERRALRWHRLAEVDAPDR